MMQRMNSEPKVEQSGEKTEFWGVEPTFFGACFFVKTLSWSNK
jgi:hypothetical protein